MKAFGIYILIVLLFAGAYAIDLFGWFVSGDLTVTLIIVIAILLLVFRYVINHRSQLQNGIREKKNEKD